jgi:hypothetical protein
MLRSSASGGIDSSRARRISKASDFTARIICSLGESSQMAGGQDCFPLVPRSAFRSMAAFIAACDSASPDVPPPCASIAPSGE